MSDRSGGGTADGTAGAEGAPSVRERIGEALRALRAALLDAVSGARERGDISTERAKEVLRTTADRALAATSDARERFDFVTRGEFDALAERVARLEARPAERADRPPGTGGS